VNPSTLIIVDVAVPAVLLIALGVGLALFFGTLQWRRTLEGMRARLLRAAVAPAASTHPSEIDRLPAPVARYLRFAVKPGRAPVVAARLVSTGEFRLGESGDKWVSFKADQLFAAVRPGFVWDARMRLAPGVGIRVVDAYVGGSGTMRAAIGGLVTVADAPDTPMLAGGELMRWLAETPWLPTALLPGGSVEWSALDEHSARATVHDGALEVSADFRFGSAGEVSEVFVPARPRDVDGTFIDTPWSGRFGAYAEEDGMMVPHEGVVQWHLPGGELPYWRGKISGARYETTARTP
jgi:Family of unknown function (DUF6920)